MSETRSNLSRQNFLHVGDVSENRDLCNLRRQNLFRQHLIARGQHRWERLPFTPVTVGHES